MLALALTLALAAPNVESAVPLEAAALSDPLDDLAPLAQTFDGVDVVYLGESTHDDGGATTARLRLVRYLHEELGFDTLLYEAPRIPCGAANEALLAGTSATKALPGCAWGFWSRTTQSAPLRAYLDAQRDAGTALRIAGMDPQNFDGDGPALAEALNQQLEGLGAEPLSEAYQAIAARLAVSDYQREAQERWPGPPNKWLKKVKKVAPKKVEQEAFLTAVDQRLGAIDSGSEAAELLGDLNALAASWTGKISAINAARDTRMAEHLLGEAENHKLIVWGASIHGAHDLATLDPPIEQVTLGDHVHDALGDSYYVVAVSAISGTVGGLYSASVRPLPEPHTESLEIALQAAGTPHAFVDLRATSSEEPLIIEALASHRRGTWRDVLDAVLVIPETEPITFEE